MEFNKQQRRIMFQNLPENIKEIFTATETTQYLKTIGEARDLSVDERRDLGEAVGLVLLGILTMKEFQQRLYDILPGSQQSINKVVKDIQRQIFQPIAGQLRKLDPQAILRDQEEDEGGKEAANIPVPPPPGDGDAPGPSYGGASDPYKEPVDN